MSELPDVGTNDHVIETELTRDLGLVSVLAIGIGTMIAAGIFTLSGLAVGYVGSAAIASFLLAALVATFTALTYCEFSALYPQSGEGYLYARRTFPALIAYMVGWCLLLGYTASCGFYIASFSSYFNEFILHSRVKALPGLMTVGVLILLNIKGTKESGNFQVVVTIGKVVLLLWFVGGGLLHVDPTVIVERFSTDFLKIGSTAAMVFITFFGFSAIAASAGEVRNPVTTIPRAIFISMGFVTVLYTLVVLVVVAANLSEYTESAMGTAAQQFLGSIGGMVIVGGALFSMVSASNASILAGSRVALSMSRLGHLPKEFGSINPRTRTPIVALLLVGAGIATFAMLLPLEALAHFADCVLLIALILVNAALIQHRRKFPNLKRPFRVPFVPALPALGILANLYLLSQVPQLAPVLLALGALVVGFLGFMGWKGAQLEVEALPGRPSRVALEQTDAAEADFRILVPLAHPANVDSLIDIAAAIAHARNGHLIALRVVVVPEQLPPRLESFYVERERAMLDAARRRGRKHDVPMTSLVRIGHNPARAILETSRERECDLMVLGWKGHTSTARHILGEITDAVVLNARTDIMLVKLTDAALPKRLLLPTHGGVHAQQAENYAANIAGSQNGTVTLCTVVPVDAQEELIQSENERLQAARGRIVEATKFEQVDIKIIQNRSVTDGIVEELKNYDGVILGAARQSFSKRILFGSIPEEIARLSDKPVMVLKHHDTVKALFGRVMSE
ncbi:MAG: amino acid permease [Myxococcales bacterium]|nr:amino acid permease [Myxococcales bacterium]MDH3483000.1 amino acid permease [Myxococcales bacterium]